MKDVEAVVHLEGFDERIDNALRSLVPESNDSMNRVEVDIDHKPPSIRIAAEDSSAMRAALNSYLRWLKVTMDISKKFDNMEE